MFQGQTKIRPTKTTAMKIQKQNKKAPSSFHATVFFFSFMFCPLCASLSYWNYDNGRKTAQHRSLTWIKNSAAI